MTCRNLPLELVEETLRRAVGVIAHKYLPPKNCHKDPRPLKVFLLLLLWRL